MSAIQLRGWQQEAFALYAEQVLVGATSALWEATPGAGKTTAALQVVRHQLLSKRARAAVVVVPTSHLRIQWARAAAQAGIQLDAAFTAARRAITSDYHGAVITYQQLSNDPQLFRRIAEKSVVVLDEVHHAGDGLAWGMGIRHAIEGASYILCLSGTAFRSDNNPIPFVRYSEDGVSSPDYVYPYSRAVDEKVCRPTAVFSYGGSVAWHDNGQDYHVSFTDPLDPTGAARRLRVALDPAAGWIQPMLRDAHAMLLATRREHPAAGGLIACADQDHARRVADSLRVISGEKPTVVLSDDATASRKIKEFSDGRTPWLVACNMVSEGVDIPRLRVGVYATATRTKLYFRQFLGRIVRRQRDVPGLQVAYLYIPADPSLKRLAEEIEQECQHALHRPRQSDFPERDDLSRAERPAPKEQSWSTIGAINSGVDAVIVQGNQLSVFGGAAGGEEARAVVERHVEIQIEQRLTRSEIKQQLTGDIKRVVGLIHRRYRRPHADIHMALNRLQRVRSQVHCTETQLRERLKLAEDMLRGVVRG